RLDADRLGQREDAVLRRADELAPELGDVAAADRAVPGPPSDAVARLEHDDAAIGGQERTRGGQAREARADDADVGTPGASGGGGGGAEGERRGACRPGADELSAREEVVHAPPD